MPPLADLPVWALVVVALAQGTAAAALLVAAWSDLKAFLIPNRVPAAVALAWLLAGLSVGLAGLVPVATLALDLAVAMGVFAVLVGLYLTGALGGGDVKLIPTVALWAGADGVLVFLMLTALAGGVLALAVLLARGAARLPGLGGWRVIRVTAGCQRLPYGVAIAVGGLWVLGRGAFG
ncbi:A24 family peptidase [Roseospirillum parvum]|uniref:Prepilin peptidase CpaA n=1 Tax=Roseospirillum parvum TaxID=83401 RepID=A0A1G8BZS1_9PROT|nr:prepilin peptidase [Roseospirillum parvum]SDH38624.1 prepilin peptidase CpaA [Roseospirillum parvum]